MLFKSSSNISNATITTIDINGRIIARHNLAKIISGVSVCLTLAVQNNKLPAGFYIIKVSGTNGELLTGKIIVR